jgi:hypothetical protein
MDLGFDENAQWQLIPLGGFRDVKLSPVAGCTAFNDHPEIADLEDKSSGPTASTRRLRIHGKKEGSGTILAPHAGGMEKLEYSVAAKQTIRCVFHFVHDAGGHKPSRAPASVKKILDETNVIIGLQSNIWLEYTAVQPFLRIDENLGPTVCSPPVSSEDPTARKMYRVLDESKALAKYAVPGTFNVFLVSDAGHRLWECLEMKVRSRTRVLAVTGSFCIYDDTANRRTLAHELGHWLSLGHIDRIHPRPRNALMGASAPGSILTKHDILTMRSKVP